MWGYWLCGRHQSLFSVQNYTSTPPFGCGYIMIHALSIVINWKLCSVEREATMRRNMISYCMRVVYEGDPENWICEECEYANRIPLSRSFPIKQPEDSKTRYKIKKPPQNSKVQYISPEEAMVLESGATKMHASSPSKPHLNKVSLPKREHVRLQSLPPKFTVRADSPIGPSRFIKIPSNRSMTGSSVDKNLSTFKEEGKPVIHKEQVRKEPPVVIGYSGRNIRTSNAALEKENEEGKPVIHKEQVRKEPPVAIGYSGRNIRTSNAALEKENGKGLMQHVSLETSTTKPFPSRKLRKVNTESTTSTTAAAAKLNVISPQVGKPNTIRDGRNSGCTSLQLVQCLPTVSSDAKPKSIDSEGRESSKVAMEPDKTLPNHIAETPTWKGSFKFIGDAVPCGSCDRLQGHPPCKVHSKVYEFSKRLPKELQFELFPRLNVWEDIFEDTVPGGLDIGLYFLPSKRHGQSCACLVEYLDRRDVLLRSCIDGVELLIFSSKHLQESSQRIHKKHFLWGLFRVPEDAIVGADSLVRVDATPQPCSDNHTLSLSGQAPMEEEPEAEDMVIDMIGGQDMSNTDIIVPKPTQAACVYPKEEPEITAQSPIMERKASPGKVIDRILEFSPTNVKMEYPDSIEEGSGRLSSCLKDELVLFEKELQQSFDRFSEMMQRRGRS